MLPIEIQKDSGIPIYVQFIRQVRLLIDGERLLPGTAMPTVREMAVELGINYNTVARIYRDLQAEGLLVMKRGIGTFVADTPPDHKRRKQMFSEIENEVQELIQHCRDLEVKRPELFQYIEMIWKESQNEIR